MKSWILGSVFFLAVVCWTGVRAYGQSKQIPKLYFLDTDSNVVSNEDIPEDSALLLLYFRTDCDECRHTAQQIKNNAGQYPLTIWMVSPNDLKNLSDFEYMAGLMDIPNVAVLQDSKSMMHRLYSFTALPFVVLYNNQGKEVKTYDYLPNAPTIVADLKKK